jgi:Glycosyl transferase family 2
MYYLSVGAIFRNESDSIVEWIKHYLYRGVEHFYLINDNSNDDSIAKIQPFIDNGLITLYHSEEPYYLGRQRNLYNRFILPHAQKKDTQWILMVDLDEYVWSPLSIRIDHMLRTYCSKLGQIQMRQHIYGSNGHTVQPESLVKHFTKRASEYINCYKYFINTNFDFSSLNIHHANFTIETYKTDPNVFMIIDPNYMLFNHYSCQSLEFWEKVKCTRGDGDAYLQRDLARFHELDKNDVEDLRLWEQNKEIK